VFDGCVVLLFRRPWSDGAHCTPAADGSIGWLEAGRPTRACVCVHEVWGVLGAAFGAPPDVLAGGRIGRSLAFRQNVKGRALTTDHSVRPTADPSPGCCRMRVFGALVPVVSRAVLSFVFLPATEDYRSCRRLARRGGIVRSSTADQKSRASRREPLFVVRFERIVEPFSKRDCDRRGFCCVAVWGLAVHRGSTTFWPPRCARFGFPAYSTPRTGWGTSGCLTFARSFCTAGIPRGGLGLSLGSGCGQLPGL